MVLMPGSGAGSSLPTPLLIVAGVSTLVAVLISTISILLQLRNYRKPALQRMVVRIMVMVPLYAIASWISLFSVEAAFFIDAIRDVYEAFVIYCFFSLLLSYLGGERSLLIMLHGRPPKEPVFPANLFKREIDVSDPYTFLFLKRGILQYVQIKPVLAIVTMILKIVGKFNEGDFRANSGYLYVSIIYNISICLALYCLAMFWVVVNDDLTPFRPVPKFLCVKGILFFSFWQSLIISALVAAHVITRLGPYTNPENVSVGLNDLFICMEMPFFAIAHNYAFSYHDFIDQDHSFVARMPMYYAFRDAFGVKDVVEDSKATLRGEGMDYREFEPAEGLMHQGVGLENRIRAGLRYSNGGRTKYWLPKATEDSRLPGRVERVVNKAVQKIAGEEHGESVHAPLLANQAESVVHLAPDMVDEREETVWDGAERDVAEEGYELPFGEIDDADEELFVHSKRYLFGDYNYPTIDVSSESAKITIWTEEERVLRDERGAWFSPIRGSKGVEAMKQREGFTWRGYGAVGNNSSSMPPPPATTNDSSGKRPAIRFYDEEGGGAGERTIDHEQERMSAAVAAESKDVVMKWTRIQRGDQSGSRSRTTSHTRPVAAVAGTSSSGSSPRVRSSSPLISRRNSRLGAPDAVDLVVEVSSPTEEIERRKGEPSVRGSALKKKKKVYTGRGLVGDQEEEEREVVVGDDDIAELEHRSSSVEPIVQKAEEPSAVAPERVGSDAGWMADNRVDDVVVVAPAHSHPQTYRYDDILDDHNPWDPWA